MAVGESGDPTFYFGPTAVLTERWNGRSWAVQPTPPSPYTVGLTGVSCRSATTCVGVGERHDGWGNPDAPIAERWSGNRWSILSGVHGTESQPILSDVWCTAPSKCVGVGALDNVGDIFEAPLAGTLDKNRWSTQ